MAVHDAYNDPYARRATARIGRRQFEQLKKTPGFHAWRTRQIKVQRGKCAYCLIELSSFGIITHVDHVTPLYHGGGNDYRNLVLTCRRCNMRKFTSNRYVVPDWIVEADRKMRERSRLRSLREDQKRQAIELLDDALYESLREWV